MIFSLLLSLWLTAPQDHTFIQRLDDAVNSGELSAAQSIRYRELAVKQPEALPLPWQEVLNHHPLSDRSGTYVLVDAYQKGRKAGVKGVFGMPSPLQFYVDSEVYPLRVYYDEEALEEKAIETLLAAEYSWEMEIDVWGFYAPPIVSPDGKYNFYLAYAGGQAAGYTSPLGPVAETPHDDCSTYIVIEESMNVGSIHDTVAHELNHATQAAMDCLEPVTFWENTAVFTESAVYPSSRGNNSWFGYYFQISPHLSISENRSPYWYGGYLWPTYLAHIYGEGWDDVPFVREIWERTMQESGDSNNTIHYMQAIDELLTEKGSSLPEAFHLFSSARFFVDERHLSSPLSLPEAQNIFPVPPLVDTLSMGEEGSAVPSDAEFPKPYGVNYFLLRRPDGYRRETRVTLAGKSSGVKWALQVVPLDNLEGAITKEATGISVSIDFMPEETGSVVVVVEQLGGEEFNPNRIPVVGEEYRISVGPKVPLPIINLVSPGMIKAGEESEITVYGGNFQEGAVLSFLPANGIEVVSTEFVGAGQIKARISIPKEALTGYMTLVVTNPDGGETEEANAFLLDPADPEAGGGGCSQGSGPGDMAFPAFLLLALFFLRRNHTL